MSKLLVAYYTRSGNSERIANKLASEFGADVDMIVDKKNRKGIFGFLSGGKDASMELGTEISFTKDPSEYDAVVLVSPVWADKVAPAVRTYANENKEKMKNTAIVVDSAASDPNKSLENFKDVIPEPMGVLGMARKHMKDEEESRLIKEFAININNSMAKGEQN